jgi:DNA repair protein RadA/Sms
MAKPKKMYRCSVCGDEFSTWFGQCPSCKEYGTLEESIISPKPANSSNKGTIKQLKDVDCKEYGRIITGINEFDRVMGGGIVPDSISILSAPPGTGKSTLCLMLCDKMLELGMNVLYASGEESETQIKNRASRLRLEHIDELWIANKNCLDDVVETINEQNIQFAVIDSIQTFYLKEFLPSSPGKPVQVKECSNALRDLAKDPVNPKAIMLIGQMNKDDELAGERSLEHLVDTCLQLDGDSSDSLRTLFSTKNRFGSVGEMGFFNMEETGLISIDNPSEYFMTEREDEVVGTALTVIREGSRSIIAEIESLVSQSYTPYPSRIGDSLKKDLLGILVSILEQRGKINLFNKNVIIKSTGGIKLKEPHSNLAILMAVASSFYEKPIPQGYVYIADVGLTGELKKVPSLEMRIRELDRMGYKKVFISPNSLKINNFKTIEVCECKTLLDVIRETFGENVKRQTKKAAGPASQANPTQPF